MRSMSTARSLVAAVLLLSAASLVRARVNATSAFEVLATTECEECTFDTDSIWCAEGSGYIQNSTYRQPVNVAPNGDDASGPYCWEGTFGKMLRANENSSGILGSDEWVVASLQCKTSKLYYNQCILPATVAIILAVIGGILCISFTSCAAVCFGCCRCGTESNYGCCNKVCPSWWPCCVERDQEHEEKEPTDGQKSMFSRATPGIDEEGALTGRSVADGRKADGGAAAALLGLTGASGGESPRATSNVLAKLNGEEGAAAPTQLSVEERQRRFRQVSTENPAAGVHLNF